MFEIQKKVGFLISGIGAAVGVANFLYLASRTDPVSALRDTSVFLLFILAAYSLITLFIDSKLVRFTQFLFLCSAAGLAIMDQYDSVYGVGLIFLATILGFKYRYFEKRAVFKLLIIGIYTYAIIEISVAVNDRFGGFILGFDALAFLTLMVVFIFLLYRDEIKSYLERQKRFSTEIDRLKQEKSVLELRIRQDSIRLKELNKKIVEFEQEHIPLDLEALQISPAEERVLRTLCTYRCDNREIARRLNIAVPTVKVHLSHVMDKLGVDDRYAVIDMCRNNY